MRKIYLFVGVLICLTTAVSAQKTRTFTGVHGSSSIGLKGSSNEIVRILTPKLSLTPAQQTQMSKAVFSYMLQKDKANAQGEQAKKTANTSFNTLVKGILDEGQYSKFQGLKPSTNDPKNRLSPLYY